MSLQTVYIMNWENFISVQYFAIIERGLCKEELLKLFWAIIVIIVACYFHVILCSIIYASYQENWYEANVVAIDYTRSGAR